MNFSIFRILVLTLCLPLSLKAQQLNFRNYSIVDGLAQSQVYAMAEDNRGNLWFGTRGGGVSRFDGIDFQNYTVQDGLPSNFIQFIFQDRKGNLWFGTDEGLSKYDGLKFKNYNGKQGLFHTKVNCLMEDNKGIIWIGTDKGIFQLEKDTIYRFGRKLGAPLTPVTCLVQDQKGNVWAGTEFGIYFFDISSSQKSVENITVKNGLPANIITSIFESSPGNLWICTYGGGVCRYDGTKFEKFTMKEGLGSNTVYSITKDREGLWFGTANGVTQFLQRDTTFIIKNYTDTEGLPNNVIMTVLKDSFGNIWMGTSGGGVSKLDSKRFVHFTEIKGVFGPWVYSIFQDSKEQMWFGTSEGGVTKYDGFYYKKFSQKDHFTASKVKCIHENLTGDIWFGTISDGAFQYDGKTFRHYNKQTGLSSNFINDILTDTSGAIWFATAGGGISCLLPNNKIKSIKVKDGLPSDRVNALLLDDKNNIWAATTAGLSCIIPGNDSIKIKILNYYFGEGRGNNQLRSLSIDKKRKIYIGTADAGVLFFDGNKLRSIEGINKIASRNIYSLIFDEDDNLWVGTEKGLDKITFENPGKIAEVKHYGKNEGFIGIEAIQNSAFKDINGSLWFGSIKCATQYNPQYDLPVKSPHIFITGIQLFFDPINKTIYGKNSTPWYSIPKTLQLPYDKNHLSFQFIGIEQRNPEAVKYKWKLEGFDEDWSPVSDRREAVYSNLPPGEYTFKVMARNESGVWNEKAQAFSFVIEPPYWRTWWFGITIGIIIIAVIWLFVSWRYKRIKKENELERARLAMERDLLELEQKALRLQMNPHFLFNSLNSIKGLIAEDKPGDAKIYLSKFSKLMRSMLDNSRETFIPLSNELESLKNYLELEKLSMGEKLDYVIQTSEEINPESTLIPPMLIQPFVENSVVHGLAPKKGSGLIKVILMKENEFIKCLIQDDGIGRDAAKKLKNNSSHKSSAIAITQERLNIINKKLNLEEIKISTQDMLSISREVIGTRVTLMIPFIKE